MRKLFLIGLVISMVVAFAGVAMAGGPPGEGDNPPNQGKPTSPPCDSNHEHPLQRVPQCQDGDGAVNECPDTFAAGPLRLHLEAAGDPGHSGGSLVHACLTLGNPPPAPAAPCPPEGEIVAVQTDQETFITVCVLI